MPYIIGISINYGRRLYVGIMSGQRKMKRSFPYGIPLERNSDQEYVEPSSIGRTFDFQQGHKINRETDK
jgi:hypothetical protein